MTVGVAILDLQGHIRGVDSFKEVSRAEITKHIISFGRAVLIATDVHQPPKMVKKMATALNSRIYAPYRDLAVNAKNEMVDDYVYGDRSRRSRDTAPVLAPQNAHERDALAAAIQGYKNYQKKLEQIEKKAIDLGLPLELVDNVKIMVINEVPITKAINATLEKLKPDDLEPGKKSTISGIENKEEVPGISLDSETAHIPNLVMELRNKIKFQKKQIMNLKKKNNRLSQDIHKYQQELSQLENKIERLQYQYSQNIMQQREITTKNSIIKGIQEKYNREKGLREELENQLGSIKRIRAMELSREATPVKIIKSFSKDSIREATTSWNIKKDDVVLLKSSEGGGSQTASLLVDIGVKAVLTTDKMSHQAREEFERNMVPLIERDAVHLEMADDFAVIRSRDLERQISKWKKNQEEEKKREDRNKLLKIMDDYRAKRKRSTNNF
jgi:predicted RNase H-like nuclease (RuvC/YqgF family)